MFLFYVNDIPNHAKSTTKLFADDCKLYRDIKTRDDCALLQDDLDSLAAWSRDWLLRFSREKCVALCIHSPHTFPYSTEGHYLEKVEHQKDLGVIISSDLNPSCHIQTITKKVSQRIRMIKRCFTNKSPTVLQLYSALVHPIMETN